VKPGNSVEGKTLTPTLDQFGSTTITVTVDDGVATVSDTFVVTVNPVNDAPTVVLSNTITTLAEDTDTTARIKVTDIIITDDALGTNTLSFSGADSAMFEVDGAELFLKAGAALDYETNAALEVIVEVDDTVVGSMRDDAETLTITIINSKPTAFVDTISAAINTVVNSMLLAADTDGDTLTYEIVHNGSKGTAEITNNSTGAFTYTPNAGEFGTDTFTFKVNNGLDDSTTVTITVDIYQDIQPETITMSLKKGWNNVGFVLLNPVDIRIALQKLILNLNLIKVIGDGKNFDPEFSDDVNTLQELRPGLGYWIKVNHDQDFQFNQQ